MKDNLRKKLNIALIIAMMLLVGVFSEITAAAADEDVDTTTSVTIAMTVDYGYSHYAKYGRYMSVSATLTNNGEDFEGWLQVIVPKAEDNVVYRKEVKITSASPETIVMNIPVLDDTGILQVKLVDENYTTVVDKSSKIKIGNYEKQTYIGVLTDEKAELDYLSTLATKVFYLNGSKLQDDYLGLDSLDIIVVNHYDTKLLNDKQIEAIKNWVHQGGTLVIGTGEYASDTLAKFADTYSITYTNKVENHNINFGLNNDLIQELKQNILDYENGKNILLEFIKSRNEMLKAYGNQLIEIENTMSDQWAKESIEQLKIIDVNKNIVDVRLEGGTTEVMENKCRLMQVRTEGHGTVQLFSFAMGLDKEANTLGVAMLASITDNMSVIKQAQLQDEYYGTYLNYGIYNSMSYADVNAVPKVGGYIIILVIYIILVGPATYLILKKLDKRSLTWIAVPILAIVFTLLVYILGSDTRINEPYAGYVEIITMQNDNTAKDEVYFGLTAPYNHNYSIGIDRDNVVTQLSDSTYNYYRYNMQQDNRIDYDNYMTAINVGFDQTKLEVNNNPAFKPVYYQSQSTRTLENQLTYDIHYTGEEINGTVTNGFNFNLVNVMLMSDGYLIHIGSIGHGETIRLEGKDKVFLTSSSVMYNESIINQVAGGTTEIKDNTAEMNRKSNVLYYLAGNNMLECENNSYVIGFLEKDTAEEKDLAEEKNAAEDKNNASDITQNSLINELSQKMDSYGTKIVMFPIDIDYTKEDQTFVPSIDAYMDIRKGSIDKNNQTRYLTSENMTVEYDLPEEDSIISFDYITTRNGDLDSEYEKKFEGKIYFLNNSTGSYDQVFQSSVGSRVTNLSNYVTNHNTLTIRYSTDISLQGYQMIMPHISYWKEADAHAED